MSSDHQKPFIDSRAFVKEAKTYVDFSSQTNAMLASLQLFHDVPCHIMDLVLSVVTHPDFDTKQITLSNSVDVIDVVEERRLKDRMAVVHRRSLNSDGYLEQAGFSQFILDEVLDIIHADRLDTVKARFEETLDNEAMYYNSMRIKEDNILKAMSLVHRSWTIPAQKALGRILHIGRPSDEMEVLLDPVRKSIFGPWTSVIAIQLFCPIERIEKSLCVDCDKDKENSAVLCYSCAERYDYEWDDSDRQDECAYVDGRITERDRQWFENLHRIVVSFTHLKCFFLKSYTSSVIEWCDHMFKEVVRRNMHLEEIIMYVARGDEPYDLSPLIQNLQNSEHLRTLKLQGAWFNRVVLTKAMRGPCFARLTSLTAKRFYEDMGYVLEIFRILSAQSNLRLKSLCILDDGERDYSLKIDTASVLNPTQCATLFGHLRVLHIDSTESADQWFELIGPYCPSLESLSIVNSSDSSPIEEYITQASASSQASIMFNQLSSLRIDSVAPSAWLEWIGPNCPTVKDVALSTDQSVSPTVLHFIPSTIQSIHVQLLTSYEWGVDKNTTNWIECLLKVPSSERFQGMKSFTFSLSRSPSRELQGNFWRRRGELKEFHERLEKFDEEISSACEDVGIACNLHIY